MPSRPFMRFQDAVYRDEAVHLHWYLTSGRAYDSGDKMPVQIYRQSFPDFSRPDDRDGFFEGLGPQDDDLLFEGEVKLKGKKLQYIDEDVEIYETYAYWINDPTWDAPPLGPRPVRIRHPDVFWSLKRIDSRLESIAQHPMANVTKNGRSVEGRPLRSIHAGNTDTCVSIIGLIHASESGPELILPILERMLNNQPDLLKKAGLAILPIANPDRRKRVVEGIPWYIRRNANGVDLNRNFDSEWEAVDNSYGLNSSDPDSYTYRGPFPESEPETRAIVSFINDFDPSLVMATHNMASICGASMNAANPDNDATFRSTCQHIASVYTEGMYGSDRDVKLQWINSSGSLKTWLYNEYGIPGFALEYDGPAEAELAAQDETPLSLLNTYRDRHFNAIVSLLEWLANDGTR